MKKLQVWWPFFAAITMILGMYIGFQLRSNIPESQGFFGGPKKASVQEVIDLLQKKYVDSVHTDSLTDDAIQALLTKLDPHTVYIPAVYTTEANEDLKGNYEGIGVEYYIIDDTINAVNILKGGPSEKAGLQIGDKFIKVNDSLIAGKPITNDGIRKLLRGESGSQVKVNLLRGSKTIEATIIRGNIPKYAVDAAYMIDAQTGFIHLNVFSKSAFEEFMASMESLQSKGMKKLIFDLRGNGGGILDEAIDIVDEFLDSTRLVVYTEGLHTKKQEYLCKRPGIFEKGEVVLLIDEFSASASEVVAGALQDWDRATIIGRRSFGKGLVQEPFDLSNGAQLRLTVSRYYTPAGRNIQKPFNGGRREYSDEVYERFHNGQMVNEDSSKHTGPGFKTLVKGRTVYGGGGITPDYFIPFDTARLSAPLAGLFNKQNFSKFTYTYYLHQLPEFKQYKSSDAFLKEYTMSNNTWNQLVEQSKKDSVNLSSISASDKEEIQQRFKAQMAMQLYRTEGYYMVNNLRDKVVLKALEVLGK